jgi:ABC-2 type transport system ATP-binding protein
MPADQHVVWASHTDRQSTYVVRTESPVLDPAWSITALGLEDVVLAYMEGTGSATSASPALEVLR